MCPEMRHQTTSQLEQGASWDFYEDQAVDEDYLLHAYDEPEDTQGSKFQRREREDSETIKACATDKGNWCNNRNVLLLQSPKNSTKIMRNLQTQFRSRKSMHVSEVQTRLYFLPSMPILRPK